MSKGSPEDGEKKMQSGTRRRLKTGQRSSGEGGHGHRPIPQVEKRNPSSEVTERSVELDRGEPRGSGSQRGEKPRPGDGVIAMVVEKALRLHQYVSLCFHYTGEGWTSLGGPYIDHKSLL